MWRSPIQICGTVWRPLFCVISARRAGSRSTRIFSSCAPLATSSRSADWQNGQAAVAYISTRGIGRLFLHRQAGLLPALEAAGEIDHPGVALLLQERHRLRRALAALAIHDHRALLALRELAGGAVAEARQRRVLRAQDVAGGVFAGVAH